MLESGQCHAADCCIRIEQAAGVRVVKDHRLPVAGPAQIQFDAPDPGIGRRVKGRQGVFEPAAVVVFAAVGDDAAGSEAMGRGRRTRPSTVDPVDQSVEHPFDPFFHPRVSIQTVIHGGIKKPLPMRWFGV